MEKRRRMLSFAAKNILVPVLLILPVIWFSFPAVFHGVDNMRMLIHFDNDEAELIKFSGKIYSQGLVPMNGYYFAYPQFFYYLAGIILGPYTFLKGIDYKVITVALRCLNVASLSLVIIFLYFFIRRFFKSIAAAVMACVLLATTPQYLWWAVNSRPHPLEIVFILMIFYFSFLIIEKYRKGFLIGAIVFSALAASVKYGGFFLIPVIWAACVYNIVKQDPRELSGYLKPKIKLIYGICVTVFILTIALAGFGLSLFLRYEKTLQKVHVNSLRDFLGMRDFRLLTGVLGALVFLTAVWLFVNMLSGRFLKNRQPDLGNPWLLYVNKSIFVLVGIAAGVAGIFLVFNPTYWLFPKQTLKAFIYQFALTSTGTGFNMGVNKPLIDATTIAWFKMLFDDVLLTPWLCLLFFPYLAFELISAKKNWRLQKEFFLKRLIFLLYGLFLFLVLFLFVSHRAHHYLLPIIIPLYTLAVFGIIEIVKKTKNIRLKRVLTLIFAVFFSAAVYAHAAKSMELRQVKLKRGSDDTGVKIGNWLEQNFSPETKIWKDYYTFYIPLKFNNFYFPVKDRVINAEELKKINPDILILTSSRGVKKVKELSVSGKLPVYKIAKEEKYKNSVEDFTVVYILTRENQG